MKLKLKSCCRISRTASEECESLSYSCWTGSGLQMEILLHGIAPVSRPIINIILRNKNFLNNLWSAGLENRWKMTNDLNEVHLEANLFTSAQIGIDVLWADNFIDTQSYNQYLPQTNYKHFNRQRLWEWRRRRESKASTRSRETKGFRSNFSKIIIFKLISLRVCSRLNAFDALLMILLLPS